MFESAARTKAPGRQCDAESDRIARYAEIGRCLDEASSARQALETEEAELTARRQAHEESWQSLWGPRFPVVSGPAIYSVARVIHAAVAAVVR